MKEFENNAYFWQKVDTLYSSGDFKLICKKGSTHKVYPSLTYPCDFGYVETLSSDTDSPMEVFRSRKSDTVDAIVICADIIEKRFEVKALVGLSEDECLEVLHFLNCTDYQKAVLLRRGKQIPPWSETE
ncbi:MAG: Inorganic pyrophosphatase [Erysipelotrichaceae bacterium]|jgi:inorganic pyrophosphatase|nr:Inorganic pyrophosphatase [Erysipelotrichaceae bacterium]